MQQKCYVMTAMAAFSACCVVVYVLLLSCCSAFGAQDILPQKLHFSDKTPYHFTDEPDPGIPKCQPVHINMVIRHGSRYPAKSRLHRLSRLLNKINPFFPSNGTTNTTFRYKALSLPWRIPDDVQNSASKELSTLGSREMYDIAKRFVAKFPRIFKHGYANNNYSFVATDKLRSTQSAAAFAHGIFEGRGGLGLGKYQAVAIKSSGPYHSDRILRIYEACRKWQKAYVRSRKNPNSEYAKFKNGEEMRKVVEKVTSRLGLLTKVKLSPGMVMEMFWMCAYGTQIDSADISWCALFQEDEMKILEYLNDLKLYWEHSYGRKINYKMSCPLYKEITDSFRRFLKNGKPRGVFRFSHTGTVLRLLTILGLYNDSIVFRANNFALQGNRSLLFSDVVPMSANVAFVLYSCDGQNGTAKGTKEHNCGRRCRNQKQMAYSLSKMKIRLLVNEVSVPMPGCDGATYCSLQRFLSYYGHIRKNCDMNAICGRERSCRKGKRRRPGD